MKNCYYLNSEMNQPAGYSCGTISEVYAINEN